jgi:hypothetical protein
VSNSSNNNSAAFFAMQRPNLTGSEIETSANREDRLSYTGADPGLWLNSAAYSNPGLFALGNSPRVNGDARTPHRNNWDFVAQKDFRMGSQMRAQIKLEVLNITNTVKTVGPTTTFGSAAFGQITAQRGFMRMTQMMFRMTSRPDRHRGLETGAHWAQ